MKKKTETISFFLLIYKGGAPPRFVFVLKKTVLSGAGRIFSYLGQCKQGKGKRWWWWCFKEIEVFFFSFLSRSASSSARFSTAVKWSCSLRCAQKLEEEKKQ